MCLQGTLDERDLELKQGREKMEQMEVLLEQMHVLNKVCRHQHAGRTWACAGNMHASGGASPVGKLGRVCHAAQNTGLLCDSASSECSTSDGEARLSLLQQESRCDPNSVSVACHANAQGLPALYAANGGGPGCPAPGQSSICFLGRRAN